MDLQSDRHDVFETDYDATSETRWYYRLYANRAGNWFWEPRPPSAAERAAPHTFQGVSWEPMILSDEQMPPITLAGPYAKRGGAIAAAEGWFESVQ